MQQPTVFSRSLECRQKAFKRSKSWSDGPSGICVFFAQMQSRYPQTQTPLLRCWRKYAIRYTRMYSASGRSHTQSSIGTALGCQDVSLARLVLLSYMRKTLSFGHMVCIVAQRIMSWHDPPYLNQPVLLAS